MGFFSKTASYAGMAFSFAISVILPFFLGIGLNWIFALVFGFAWLSVADVWNSVPALILMAVFGLAFPFAYFWLARGHALRKGLVKLYDSSHDVIEKVTGTVVSAAIMGNQAGLVKGGKIKDKKGIINQLDEKLPRSVRSMLRFFLAYVPILGAIQEIGNEMELSNANLEVIKPKVQVKVDEYVKEELLDTSLSWFWMLLLVNIAAMVGTWFWIGQ